MRSVLPLVAVLALTIYGQRRIKLRVLTHTGRSDAPGKLQYLVAMFSHF